MPRTTPRYWLILLLALALPAAAGAEYWQSQESGEQPRFTGGDPFEFHGLHRFLPGDYDGDGVDELLVIRNGTITGYNGWYVMDRLIGGPWKVVAIGQQTMGGCQGCEIDIFDGFLTGDFDGDGRTEVLMTHSDDGWTLLGYDVEAGWLEEASRWNGAIGSWPIRWGVNRYAVGNFIGDGRDELLSVAAELDEHRTLRFTPDTGDWSTVESGNHGLIHVWFTSTDDHYVTGDFDGDGFDELLAVNPANGHHQTIKMRLQGKLAEWNWFEGNGSGKIALWYLSTNDIYRAGDFDGDRSDELVAVNSSNGWSHTMKMVVTKFPAWKFLSGNGGGGFIGDFPVASGDPSTRRWAVGDFDGDGLDELLAVVSDPFIGFWHVLEY